MPRYGFNFQWILGWVDRGSMPEPPDPRALDMIAELGFDFVRIPANYWFWTHDFDYRHPDESVWNVIDDYLAACRSRGMHMSLNLHRAPGYCINRNDLERHNLWVDKIAQDAFVFLWSRFADRYQGVPNTNLSFDLVNEPPGVGEYGMTRDNHAALIRRAVAAIREIDPEREIVIDGVGGGHLAMPELADLGVIHSGRGYQPMPISHHGAFWWPDYQDAPLPKYPGLEWDGRVWDKDALRSYFQPWRDVEARGVTIHIGEFGCHNQTPNDIALRWFADLLSLFKEFGWGYSLWQFAGPFGIIEHGRPGAKYEDIHGYKVDRELLDLLTECRVQG
ncbi:MAG: cellulase family glycosylhydrolase [Anaerolineae bacterium]|nr:cellulase family glycosylhydrolase [Anaerolineae bacterium]